MIINMRTTSRGKLLFSPLDGDAWGLMEMLDNANLGGNVFIGSAGGFENCIVFDEKFNPYELELGVMYRMSESD